MQDYRQRTKDRGQWELEVISNYNATIRVRRGENISYLHYKYPNAKKIMTLQRNDMLVATFSKEEALQTNFFKGIREYILEKFKNNPDKQQITILFRVKKLSSSVICCTPHDIAKEEGDTKSWQASKSSLQEHNAKKVFVTALGEIKNAS